MPLQPLLPLLHAVVVMMALALSLRVVDALASGAGDRRPVDFLTLTDDSTGWAPGSRRGQEAEEASSSSSLLSLSSSSWLDDTASSSDAAPKSQRRRRRTNDDRATGGDEVVDVVDEEEGEEDEEASLEALLSAPALEDRKAESPWVARFCSAPAHGRIFCRVPARFIAEEFNWLDLPCRPHLEAIDRLLLGRPQAGPGPQAGPSEEANAYASGVGSGGDALQAAARRMYGLIHARYIVTQKGLNAMREKFEAAHFGTCPRHGCGGQAVLPVGLHEEPRPPAREREGGAGGGEEADEHGLKLFCPRCRELYHPGPAGAALDGAYWGTSFAHLFLLAFPELDPGRGADGAEAGAGAAEAAVQKRGEQLVPAATRDKGKAPAYVPRVFGFRVGSPQSLSPPADEEPLVEEVVDDKGPPVAAGAPAPAPTSAPAAAEATAAGVAAVTTMAPAHESITSIATRGQSRGRPIIGPGSALSFPSTCTARRRSRGSSGPGAAVRPGGRALREWLHRAVQRVRRRKQE